MVFFNIWEHHGLIAGDDGGAAQVDLRRCLGSDAAQYGWPSASLVKGGGGWILGSS